MRFSFGVVTALALFYVPVKAQQAFRPSGEKFSATVAEPGKLGCDSRDLTYKVNAYAPSLSMIARELYGDRRMADKLAVWNKLPRESLLTPGQVLRLKKRPTLSPQKGRALVMRFWRRFGRAETAARLEKEAANESSFFACRETHLIPLAVAQAPAPAKPRPVAPATTTAAAIPTAAIPAGATPTAATAPVRGAASVPAEDDGAWNGVHEPKSESYWLGLNAKQLIESISRKLQGIQEKPK